MQLPPVTDPGFVFVLGILSGIVSIIVAGTVALIIPGVRIRRIVIELLLRYEASHGRATLKPGWLADKEDAHAIVTENWATALRGLVSHKPEQALVAVRALIDMADLLTAEEKEIACDTLRLAIAHNSLRDADVLFIDAMKKMRE